MKELGKESWVDKKAGLLLLVNCLEGNHLMECKKKDEEYAQKCCDEIRITIEQADERLDEELVKVRLQDIVDTCFDPFWQYEVGW